MKNRDIKIGNYCPICGSFHEVKVNEADYVAWAYNNVSIYKALSYLNSTEREQLITKLCPKCVNDDFN